MVDGVLYAYTPTQKVFALDARDGKLLWKFDSGIVGRQPDRGLASWTDGKHRRILAGVMNFVYALDAQNGKPITTFGEGGRIDLRENLGRDPQSVMIALTSPGIVYKDLLIVGGREPESLALRSRRYSRLRRSHRASCAGRFIPFPIPANSATRLGPPRRGNTAAPPTIGPAWPWTPSAASSMCPRARPRLISTAPTAWATTFLPTACSPSMRKPERESGIFRESNTILWDRDFPSPPVLVTVDRDGKPVDAVAETSKQGYVYLFDRVTGEPLFPIDYRPYPPSDVPGEVAATTQPLPTLAGTFRSPTPDGRYGHPAHSGSAPMGAGAVPKIP